MAKSTIYKWFYLEIFKADILIVIGDDEKLFAKKFEDKTGARAGITNRYGHTVYDTNKKGLAVIGIYFYELIPSLITHEATHATHFLVDHLGASQEIEMRGYIQEQIVKYICEAGGKELCLRKRR